MTAYRIDLNKWVTWLATAGIGVFDAERAHIELYALRMRPEQLLRPEATGRWQHTGA